ncbi:serine/threonine-protein phosphatase PP1-2-like [Ctenocephalides felis]|uniref:serine/threonine-protein phosphatase PP1-2-like n=1 Tax=Ctenocephalides felis TaxID=7515 RepID=UPI000E6E26DD|nr:serine/threonine-protein phosphatase PP1-2-like [Ctenocephalides felis]
MSHRMRLNCDLHGNLPDLLGFERVLWNLGPALSPSTLLFLGDYVDRGPHGVEVVAYLFAYKLQNPAKIKLLRGNHEVRDVQKMFTFYTECVQKFGDTLGKDLWNAINNVFDAMPIAAVIDSKIFCVHGGIPPPWLCPVIATINDIPIPLTNPDEQSQLAWELMWNDPIKTRGADAFVDTTNSDGFANNTRRGTAHVFNQAALDRFLSVNSLSHVVRAHEMQKTGFYIQYSGHLITVFTSSHYCGGDNEAACLFVNNNRIRVIRVDTE